MKLHRDILGKLKFFKIASAVAIGLGFGFMGSESSAQAKAQSQTQVQAPAEVKSELQARDISFAPTKPASSNPDTSVNALGLYRNSSRGANANADGANGFSLQEAEVQFFSDVDPYHKFSALFSASQSNGEWKFEPEEVYAESTDIPFVTLRAGKFKAAFGKHNTLHTHAFPFIDAPLINTTFLASDSLDAAGVSGAGLLPLPWYSELTGQAFAGFVDQSDTFNTGSANANLYVAHFKNLWDLNDDITAELGFSEANGQNQITDGVSNSKTMLNGHSNVWGADFTIKWRPMNGGKYHAVIWTSEYMKRDQTRGDSSNNTGRGYSTALLYQFAERWWIQARSEYVHSVETNATLSASLAPEQRKYTALLAFLPSEFSGYRLQYSFLNDGREQPDNMVMLQFNYTIGAHPAHAY